MTEGLRQERMALLRKPVGDCYHLLLSPTDFATVAGGENWK